MKHLQLFCGGQSGAWKVLSMNAFKGKPLETVQRIEILSVGQSLEIKNCEWQVRGLSSNLRYTTREEKVELDKAPSVLGKPESKYAALIPIKKSDEWWLLTQDERRKIFEEKSQHVKFSLQYLELVSRKLYHSRDIGEEFDFVTWFEFTPENSIHFNELMNYLRQTEEWKYVIREVDIRLIRDESYK